MSEVISELGLEVIRDPLNFPVSGMLQKILVIPESTLDPVADITKSTDSLITDISPTAKGLLIEGVGDTHTMNFTEEGVENDAGRNGYILGITGIQALDPSVETREEIKKMFVGGGVVFVVFERKWPGTARDDAFLFGGFTHGLVIKNYVWNGNENKGAMSFDLMTPNERDEPFGWMVYLATNYATTETDVWTTKLFP